MHKTWGINSISLFVVVTSKSKIVAPLKTLGPFTLDCSLLITVSSHDASDHRACTRHAGQSVHAFIMSEHRSWCCSQRNKQNHLLPTYIKIKFSLYSCTDGVLVDTHNTSVSTHFQSRGAVIQPETLKRRVTPSLLKSTVEAVIGLVLLCLHSEAWRLVEMLSGFGI